MSHANKSPEIFLIIVAALLAAPCAAAADEPVEVAADLPAGFPPVTRVRPLTAGDQQHFVGYYGICPWNASGKLLACLESDFGTRLVEAEDTAAICVVETATGRLQRIARTSAWNHQQGAMLHWLGTAPERELIYNDRIDGRLSAVLRDVSSGKRRVIDRPVAAVSHDGRTAVSINYERLRKLRPVVGYAGGPEDFRGGPHPDDDGLFRVDLATGKARLIVSLDQAYRLENLLPGTEEAMFWCNHVLFSRDDRRLFFMLRTWDPATGRLASLPLTVGVDGSDLRSLMPWGVAGASHYDWLDGKQLILTRQLGPGGPMRHLLLTDGKTGYAELAPELLQKDGHCTFSPDGQWLVTDSYPDAQRRQHLYLVHLTSGRAAHLASFHTPPEYTGAWRCDLHPRWNRDGTTIAIDSTHTGVRQVYAVELKFTGPR